MKKIFITELPDDCAYSVVAANMRSYESNGSYTASAYMTYKKLDTVTVKTEDGQAMEIDKEKAKDL